MSVTLKTIAAEVGTSIATVSLALSDNPRVNDETKERIRETSIRLGYCTPAELLRKKRQCSRKLLKYHFVDLTLQNRVYNEFVGHLPAHCGAKGIRVELVSPTGEDAPTLARQILACGAESSGMMLYGPVDAPLLELLAEGDVPCVVIGPLVGPWPDRSLPLRAIAVGLDEITTAREATEHLLQLGHKRVGLISARGTAGLYYDRWEDGYRLALSRAGLNYDAALHDNSGDSRLSRGQLPTCFTAPDPPTAFVCPDPTYANLLRHLADAERFSPANAILCGTEQTLDMAGMTDWPAFVVDIGLLTEVCIDTLDSLQYREAGAFRMITLAMQRRNLTKLSPGRKQS